jgi:hypothetical protein
MDNPDDTSDVIPSKCPETGKFLTGNKLGGRVKGSRNQITKLRLETEEALRLCLRGRSEELLNAAITQALNGDSNVMKSLLDKILTTPKDDEDKNAKPEAVKVIVVTTPSGEQPRITVMKAGDRPVIDVTPET